MKKASMNDVLNIQIHHCANLIQRLQDNEYPQLPQGQGRLMRILAKHGSLTHKELTDCMQIRSPSVTELISKLEAKGYVVKTTTKDKRTYSVCLTDKGISRTLGIKAINDRLLEVFFSNLTEIEKKLLSALICKLTATYTQDGRSVSFCEECGICPQSYKSIVDANETSLPVTP